MKIFRTRKQLAIFLSACSLFCLEPSFAETTQSAETDSSTVEAPSLTIYSQNYVLMRQKRPFDLKKGLNSVNWDRIAKTIDLNTVSLRSEDPDSQMSIKEQSYQNDLLSAQSILDRSYGKTVYLRRFLANGQSEEQSGVLINNFQTQSDQPGLIIKTGDRYIINPVGQIEINDLPSGLVAKPQLNFQIETNKSRREDLLLTYQASDVNWQCDYTIVLDSKQSKFNLSAIATLSNQCGVNFKSARLKLMAGSVQQPRAYGAVHGLMNAAAMPAPPMPARDANLFEENAFADYHLYNYDGLVDINNNETKRLTLLEGKAIPAIKKYIYDEPFSDYIPPKPRTVVQVKLEFKNTEQNHLGKPLPAGQVKIYQEDPQSESEFIGGENIDHTPIGEKVTVGLGTAFDITVEKTHTSSEQVSPHLRRDKYTVVFNNHLDHDITVTDIEHNPYNFPVISSDHPFTKKTSDTFQCDVNVPASGSTTVTYQIDSKR